MNEQASSSEEEKRILSIRRCRGKVFLTFDDESSLALPLPVYDLLKINEGDLFLSSSLLAIKEQAVDLCFAKCCRALSMRWKTTEEMIQSLSDGAWPDMVIRETVDLLLESGYLNDRRFALSFAAQRSAKGFGGRRILSELLHKGIAPAIAREAVQESTEIEGEFEDGLKKALRKATAGRDLEDLHDRQKAIASLVRKGYSCREAKDAVELLISDNQINS